MYIEHNHSPNTPPPATTPLQRLNDSKAEEKKTPRKKYEGSAMPFKIHNKKYMKKKRKICTDKRKA